MKQVLSLGAGVQSSTVLMMSIHGELPRLDAAIFADTGWDPPRVYEWLRWLEEQMKAAGIAFYRVSRGNVKQDALDVQMIAGYSANGVKQHYGSMPYYTLSPEQTEGMVRRQCTSTYKIEVIERCIKRDILGLKPRQRTPKTPVVQHWFGISFDERQRMREPQHKWSTYWYPLVERRMTRSACINWMLEHGYKEPPRSSCIGCPYHSNAVWRHMKINEPELFADACEFDRRIRKISGMRGDVYLHHSRRPLEEVDFRNDFDKGQLPLIDGFRDECSGICGV